MSRGFFIYMARNLRKDQSIVPSNDASCIGNRRGMARRAKRQSNKSDRQHLNKMLKLDYQEWRDDLTLTLIEWEQQIEKEITGIGSGLPTCL